MFTEHCSENNICNISTLQVKYNTSTDSCGVQNDATDKKWSGYPTIPPLLAPSPTLLTRQPSPWTSVGPGTAGQLTKPCKMLHHITYVWQTSDQHSTVISLHYTATTPVKVVVEVVPQKSGHSRAFLCGKSSFHHRALLSPAIALTEL